MPAPDIENIIRKDLEDLKRLYMRELPVKVGNAVQSSVLQNFRQGNFYGSDPWSAPMRVRLGFRGTAGQYGPLLSGKDHLMKRTKYRALPGRVVIFNSEVYAATHNDGDEITVTERMKGFFWGKHRDEKERLGKNSPEAEFWKRMALKKPGSKIRIPQRHFLGPSKEVDAIVKDVVDKELQEFIKKHSNGTTTGKSY